MSLLERIRAGSDSPWMQGLLFVVALSFVGWGVGTQGTRTVEVATVNGEAIQGIAFSRAVDIAERQASQGRTEPLTQDDREALRERVLRDLVKQRALVQEAQRVGLVVSDAEIAESLLDLDFLVDGDGRFDKRAYQNFLRRQGYTRGEFERILREQLLIEKLQELAILGASVSAAGVKQSWLEDSTRIDLSYVRLRASMFQDDVTPDDPTLDAWIADHGTDIQARYDRDFARLYDSPERVTVRLLRLTAADGDASLAELKAQAEALIARAEGGEAFEALVTEASDDPSAPRGGLLEDLDVPQLDANVAAALADVAVGQRTAPIVGDRDVRVYQLDARTPARTVPLDEVRRDIALALYREEQAPAVMASFAEKTLLPAWKEAGEAPAEVLATQTLTVDRTGLIAVSGEGAGLFRPPAEMLSAARNAPSGTVLPEVYEAGGVLWVGQVAGREDPDPAEFEADAAQIGEQALLKRRVGFFQAWVDDVVARATVVYR